MPFKKLPFTEGKTYYQKNENKDLQPYKLKFLFVC